MKDRPKKELFIWSNEVEEQTQCQKLNVLQIEPHCHKYEMVHAPWQ